MTKGFNPYDDDTFLSRWLAGELTDEERKAFEGHPDFEIFREIVAKTDEITPPEFNIEQNLADLKSKVSQRSVIHKYSRRRMYALIAATAAVIFLGMWFTSLMSGAVDFQTELAETMEVNLPDGSVVFLNSESSLKFNEKKFESKRTLELEGEAFFEVEKGNSFIVETSIGTIEVLGTSFNVRTLGNTLDVHCKTGSVEVVVKEPLESFILTPGNRVFVNEERKWSIDHFEDQFASWRDGVSTFHSVPFHLVLDELQKYYDLEIEKGNVDFDAFYTGQFSQKNLTQALEMIFPAMGINYQLNGNKLVLSN